MVVILDACNEYVNIIDEIYENIEAFKHSKGHTVEIPRILYEVLLKTTDPDIECLETGFIIEIDEDELIEMIEKSYNLLHKN